MNPPLGVRMRRARLASGMSQRDMAAILDVPRQRVSEWELGKHEPAASVLLRWERACGERAKVIRADEEQDGNDEYEADLRSLGYAFHEWVEGLGLEPTTALLREWLEGQHPAHVEDAAAIWKRFGPEDPRAAG